MRGPLSFEVWSQFVSAGQSNYRAAWSGRLARSEQSVCSTLTLLPLSDWPRCRGHIQFSKHLYVSPWHHVKGNANTYCCMSAALHTELHSFEVNFQYFLDILHLWSGCQMSVDLDPSAAILFWLKSLKAQIIKAEQHHLFFMQLFTIFSGLSHCNSFLLIY